MTFFYKDCAKVRREILNQVISGFSVETGNLKGRMRLSFALKRDSCR